MSLPRSPKLFWQLLVPFVALMVAVGVFGTFVVTRTLATRERGDLDQELARRSLDARAEFRQRELSLLEAVTLAANLEGMADAAARHDAVMTARLVESVLALKKDVDVVTVTGADGRLIAGRSIGAGGVAPTRAAIALPSSDEKQAALVTVNSTTMIAIGAPICAVTPECESQGFVVVASPLVRALQGTGAVAVYAPDGERLARVGRLPTRPRSPVERHETTSRDVWRRNGREVATLYSPFTLQGRLVGQLAVALPADASASSARAAAVRFALVVVLGMAGVALAGALLARRVVRQVRDLAEASRRLGQGDFEVRVPVHSDDELGDLARGVNQMAVQLQASYNTLESRVDQRTAEVQRLLQERTEFFASISHELRTPLAVIIGQAELLDDRGVIIGDAAKQLLTLVNDILDLARAEAGRLAVTPSEIDLADVIADLRPTIEGLARAGEVRVSFEVDAPLLVWGDAARLRTVLLNLADNAIKYTPPLGRVVVSASRAGRHVEVSVVDTGIGVPPEIGERLFEPFFRVPKSETQHGQAASGLGLALARRLAEAHGGSLSYASDGTSGTTFTLQLPVATRRRAARESKASR